MLGGQGSKVGTMGVIRKATGAERASACKQHAEEHPWQDVTQQPYAVAVKPAGVSKEHEPPVYR